MAEKDGSAMAVLRLLRDVESLLKHPSVAMDLGRGGINASIAILAVQGLEAYLDGNLTRAQEDLATAAEEMAARRAFR